MSELDPDGWTVVAEEMLAMTDADEMKDAGDPFPLPNVWLGVSTENQQWADIRIPALLDTPAAVRFISAEPLLGPIDLTRILNAYDRVQREVVVTGRMYRHIEDTSLWLARNLPGGRWSWGCRARYAAALLAAADAAEDQQ